MKLRFISVGGTIDKIHFDQRSEYQIGALGVERMLRDLPVAFEYTVEALLRKDSLDYVRPDLRPAESVQKPRTRRVRNHHRGREGCLI